MIWKKHLTVLFMVACLYPLLNAEIRPVRDETGFCWTAGTMARLVQLLETTRPYPPPAPGWIAGICPHDDYLYAGRIYLPLMRTIQAREVVIFGVTHGSVRRALGNPGGKIILDTHRHWKGIHGPVAVSPLRNWLRSHMPGRQVLISNQAHILEHSIEALVPFLQYFRPGVRITPIMITAMSPQEMDRVSGELSIHLATWMRKNNLHLGKDLVVLISADANHYGKDFNNAPYGESVTAHDRAQARELSLIRDCLEGPLRKDRLVRLQRALDPKQTTHPPLWCGRYSIPFGLLTVRGLVREFFPGGIVSGSLLAHSDTWKEGVLPMRATLLGTTAPFSLKHWVSFFSMAFTPKSGR